MLTSTFKRNLGATFQRAAMGNFQKRYLTSLFASPNSPVAAVTPTSQKAFAADPLKMATRRLWGHWTINVAERFKQVQAVLVENDNSLLHMQFDSSLAEKIQATAECSFICTYTACTPQPQWVTMIFPNVVESAKFSLQTHQDSPNLSKEKSHGLSHSVMGLSHRVHLNSSIIFHTFLIRSNGKCDELPRQSLTVLEENAVQSLSKTEKELQHNQHPRYVCITNNTLLNSGDQIEVHTQLVTTISAVTSEKTSFNTPIFSPVKINRVQADIQVAVHSPQIFARLKKPLLQA